MKEIEVKILEIEREKVEQNLLAFGAKKSFDGEMHALFFDSSDQSIKNRGDVLRIRKEDTDIVLTYKGLVSKDSAKIMEEHELHISDLETMQKILHVLGFNVVKETRKFRTQYDLDGLHVVIDDYQDELEAIPVFIEIESTSEPDLYRLVEKLGFEKKDCLSWDTRDLVRHYL